jgi:hypothetical protein
MSPNEITQIILAVATLVGSVGALLVSVMNAIRLRKVASEVNGMKKELVASVSKERFAAGQKDERDRNESSVTQNPEGGRGGVQ